MFLMRVFKDTKLNLFPYLQMVLWNSLKYVDFKDFDFTVLVWVCIIQFVSRFDSRNFVKIL